MLSILEKKLVILNSLKMQHICENPHLVDITSGINVEQYLWGVSLKVVGSLIN
jgi:hypothetical protein